MRYAALILGACMALGGCTTARDSSTRVMDDVETGTSSTWHKMRDMLDLEGKPVARPTRTAQPGYCYRTYEDVVCYSTPLAGQEERLLAYQDKGSVGYVIDPPREKKNPAIAKAVFLPPKTTAEQPAASVKPKEAGKAEEGKKDEKHLKEITFDPSELEPKKLVPDKMQ